MRWLVQAGQLKDVQAYARSFPQEAPGWVDGVYAGRPEVRTALAEPAHGAQGVLMSGSVVVEETDPVNGDANTIARATYYAGTQLEATMPERTFELHLTVASCADASQTWYVVVNDRRIAQVTVTPHAAVAASCEAVLTSRAFALMLVPAGVYDDGAAAEAKIELVDLSLAEVPAPADHHDTPALWIAADSTVQTYFDRERPQSGWGEWLAWHLYGGHRYQSEHDAGSCTVQAMRYRGDGPQIHNRALGARSARSYVAEGRLEALFRGVCPGDWLIIQFGLNDASPNRPMRYVPVEEYPAWLARYVEGALDRGMHPVLVTAPPQYRAPGADDAPTVFDAYADATRVYAREADVPLIDLRREMAAYLAALPAENRAACYLRAPARQWESHPDGVADTVHLSTYGAFVCAGIIARGLAALSPAFTVAPDDRPPLTAPTGLIARGITGIVGLEAELRWDAVPGADYYTVEKRCAETGHRYDRLVTTQPRARDLPLPGQSRQVIYEVRAWRAGEASAGANVALTLPASDDGVPCARVHPVA